MKKKLLCLSLAAVMGMGLLSGCGSKPADSGEKVVKIGVFACTTGANERHLAPFGSISTASRGDVCVV